MAEEKTTKTAAKPAAEKKAAAKPAAEKKAAAKPAAEKKAAAKPAAEKKAAAKPAAEKKPAEKPAAKLVKKASAETVTIKLIKGFSGRLDKQIATAKSLGLRRVGDVTVQPDNDATRGKIRVITHMVAVTKQEGTK